MDFTVFSIGIKKQKGWAETLVSAHPFCRMIFNLFKCHRRKKSLSHIYQALIGAPRGGIRKERQKAAAEQRLLRGTPITSVAREKKLQARCRRQGVQMQ